MRDADARASLRAARPSRAASSQRLNDDRPGPRRSGPGQAAGPARPRHREQQAPLPISREELFTPPPTMRQPVVRQPVVREPDREPVVRQPVVRQPVVRQPVVRQPVVRQPVVRQPMRQPAATQPFGAEQRAAAEQRLAPQRLAPQRSAWPPETRRARPSQVAVRRRRQPVAMTPALLEPATRQSLSRPVEHRWEPTPHLGPLGTELLVTSRPDAPSWDARPTLTESAPVQPLVAWSTGLPSTIDEPLAAPTPPTAPWRTAEQPVVAPSPAADRTPPTDRTPSAAPPATAPAAAPSAPQVAPPPAQPEAPPVAPPARGGSTGARPVSRRSLHQQDAPRRRVARPLLAGGLVTALGVSALGYAAVTNLQGTEGPAFVVGAGVAAQTDELAKAALIDTSYRAAASVSRNERRTAIAAAGVASAKEAEARAKAEAERLAQEAAERKRRAELAAAREAAIANARANPREAARVLMADYGWTSDAQYNCLVNLWNGESGWRYTAGNPSSGAYGIPQSLPASKMAMFGSDYRTNPVTQIKWGLWYIAQTYGNPCNAWSTWLSRSPHWY